MTQPTHCLVSWPDPWVAGVSRALRKHPSRACTLLLLDDIVRCDNDVRAGAVANLVANYADPAFSRSNVHSVMALSSMLTPLFTCIRTATIMMI